MLLVSVGSSRSQMFFKKNSPISQKSTCAGVFFFFVKLVTFLRTSLFYRTPPVAASDLSLVQIPKFEGQFQLCLLLLGTLRVLFEETIIRTISSVIARSTNEVFWILFMITTMYLRSENGGNHWKGYWKGPIESSFEKMCTQNVSKFRRPVEKGRKSKRDVFTKIIDFFLFFFSIKSYLQIYWLIYNIQ